jgi:hypothetical protein
MDFFGRDNADELVEQPFRGFTQALMRARIPFVPLHLDHLDRDSGNFSVLILPNIGAMSDAQIDAVRRFVARGGALIATGQTSLFDQWGDARADFALADLFGVSGGKPPAETDAAPRSRNTSAPPTLHTYLRINDKSHPAFTGFGDTAILPFGGTLHDLTVVANAKAIATFIPVFPQTPPEIVWMRTPHTEIPGLVINEGANMRVAYLPADIDRLFANHNFPDHGDLLANIVRWAAGDSIPLEVLGAGLVDCELYRQENRLILHVLNLTSAGTWRAPMHELIAIGPLQIKIRLPEKFQASKFKTLVSTQALDGRVESGWATFELKSILDHEVVVIES